MDLDRHFNLVKEILDKTEEEINKMDPVSILVVGKTGVGKSTLINHLFRERLAETGFGKPVTRHLRKITKEGIPLVLYDSRGLELDPVVQEEAKKEMFAHLKSDKEKIDLSFYCINAHSARIEQSEIRFIEELAVTVPVILVLTQSFGEPTKEFKRYIENLNLPVAGVQSVLAAPYPVSKEYILPQYGLDDLVTLAYEVLPRPKRDAFNNAQQGDIDRKAKAARKWTSRYIAASFGIGFAPIPFSDASLLVPMQVTLLAHITAIFGVSIDKATLVSLIAAVGGTGSATLVGRTLVTNALKFIPGAGTLVGGAISGTTAAIVTSALAASYIEALVVLSKGERDGKYPDLKDLQELMKQKFKERLQKKGTHGTAGDDERTISNGVKHQKLSATKKWMQHLKKPFIGKNRSE